MIESDGIRAGIDAGFEMDYFFSENYAFSTGLSINNLGGRLKFQQSFPIQFQDFTQNIDPGNTVIYRLHYVNLPLGMKFTTREIGYTTVFVKLGSTAHFNIRSNADIPAHRIENESLENEIEPFIFSYNFSAGIQYSLGGQTAVVGGIEYKHRFIDIMTNPGYKALLNSIALRLGILF